MKKYQLVTKLLFIAVLFLAVARVVVSNTLSTSGVALGKINDEISFYQTENAKLSEKFYRLASLSNIATEAARLGFKEKKGNFVLTSPLPIAQR